jgi:hypothetical protein
MGMADSELARLLIAREQRHRQLAAFLEAGGNVRRPVARAPEPPKITAHLPSKAQAREFAEYAARCGLTCDRAVGWLFEHELQERWLERAFGEPPAR